MADIGALGAQTYRMNFPSQQQQFAAQQPIGPQPVDVDIPELGDDPIAVREGITSDYYNSLGLLRSFATDMARKGIDPFTPDYSQDGGGLAFQTMQKLQANTMFAANALGNEFKAETQMRPILAQGQARPEQGVNLNQGMAYSDPNNFYATSLDPIVTQANQVLGDARYTQGDSNRLNQAVRDPRISRFEQLKQQDPNNATYYQRQIDALLQNTPQTAYQQLIPRSGRGSSNEVEILKKVTNLSQGVWPEGTYNVSTRGGKAMLENKTFAGEYLGDYQGVDTKGNPKVYRKIVKRWLKDPDTGEVMVEFDDPNIPREVVSNTTGDVIASALIANNPKYGSASKMYETAREMGFLDDTSSAMNSALISENADQLRQIAQQKAQAGAGSVAQQFEQTKKAIQSIGVPTLGNNTKTFTTPDGRQVKIGEHRAKNQYYIDNWEELGYSEEPKNLSIDKVLEYLDSDFNYFTQFLGQPQGTPKQQQAIEAFTKQFGRQPSQSEKEKILAKYK